MNQETSDREVRESPGFSRGEEVNDQHNALADAIIGRDHTPEGLATHLAASSWKHLAAAQAAIARDDITTYTALIEAHTAEWAAAYLLREIPGELGVRLAETVAEMWEDPDKLRRTLWCWLDEAGIDPDALTTGGAS